MREYGPNDPSGSDVRWTARFGLNNLVQSYRGFKQEWHGTPTTAPDLVVQTGSDGCATGYVSWNGATDVDAWVVLEGPAADQLVQVSQVEYKGFETEFVVVESCVQVAAVIKGKMSMQSSIVC